MLIGIFYSQIVESSSLVSVLFREVFSHPYISFFHLLVNGFSVIIIRFSNGYLNMDFVCSCTNNDCTDNIIEGCG